MTKITSMVEVLMVEVLIRFTGERSISYGKEEGLGFRSGAE